MKLLSGEYKDDTERLLDDLYRAPFIYYKDKNYINALCNAYEEKSTNLSDYISYYKKQWYKCFKNVCWIILI